MLVKATSQNLSLRFRNALSQPLPPEERELVMWRLIVGHPWYQVQLKHISKLVVRCQPASILSEDVQQEAVLLLARSLKRDADLQFDPKQPDKMFSRWMRKIILHDCRQAVRRLRRGLEPLPLPDDDLPDDGAALQELHLDLKCSLQILLPPERFIIDQYLLGGSLEETADQLAVSVATVRRRFQRAIAILQQYLD
jgi:RNA polymerase sigma factor (sigma-70 family)